MKKNGCPDPKMKRHLPGCYSKPSHYTQRERETEKERENKLFEDLESFTPLLLNIRRSLSLWPGVESLSWWAEVLQSLTSDTARPVAVPSRFLETDWRSGTVLGSAHLFWQWNCRHGGGKGGGIRTSHYPCVGPVWKSPGESRLKKALARCGEAC